MSVSLLSSPSSCSTSSLQRSSSPFAAALSDPADADGLQSPSRDSWFHRDERGQATAEYALVLLGAAAVALLVVAWATKTDLIGSLLDSVMTTIAGKAKTP